MKVVDIVYYAHNDFATPQQVIEKHAPSFGYVEHVKERLDIQLIKHFKNEIKEEVDGVPVVFFKRSNSFWNIPLKTHLYVRSTRPDVVIIEGLIFPLQIIALKVLLRRRCSIVVQHHGESPYRGYKRLLQVIADKFINAYMFTSNGNSAEWIEQKVIRDEKKCSEVLEASTFLSNSNKEHSRKLLDIKNGIVFLWVGRLNENKDPLTVLESFGKYLAANDDARLYMIYQTEELLPQINELLQKNLFLKKAVTLVGKVVYADMRCWYSAADFYISGSHKEGSGYALLEAMSCGCIPIVTSIPSFQKITKNGDVGFLYPPADVEYLSAILKDLPVAEIDKLSKQVIMHFKEKLSFKNIADDIYNLCLSLHRK